MIYIADTHPVVWFLEGNPRLGNNAKAVLSDPQTHLVIPTIVLRVTFDIEKIFGQTLHSWIKNSCRFHSKLP